jgi:DNA-binding MarR family transcriptional regulator
MLDASIVLRCVESQVVLTPGKLAAALGRDKGTITRALDRLERECSVTRVVHKFDRRISLLKPTKRATKIASSLKALFSAIRRQLFCEMNEDDFVQLARTLARLGQNATDLGRDSAMPRRRQLGHLEATRYNTPRSGTSKQVRRRKLFEPMQNL